MIKQLLLASFGLALSMNTLAEIESKNTRFGTFEIKENPDTGAETAYFNKKMINPLIEGNNSLSLVGKYQIGGSDILLVQDNGGTGCPAELYFINITQTKVPVVSPRFGSCSDLIDVVANKDKIIVKMPVFLGIPEDPAMVKKLANKKVTYEYDGKVLKENGKLFKRSE